MSMLEWIATVLGVACVALAARRNVWTFPTAIGSVVLLGVVVFEARLYSDAMLQGFFVAANLYGWANWMRARHRLGEVAVERMSNAARAGWAIGWAVATLLWGAAMHRFTNAAYPWWDAGIAAASVAGQVLMARRRIENWAIWIAVDLASVPMYALKGLYLFAGLYVIYLALAVWGLIDWRRAEHRPVAALAA
ncbi:nicotinamide riboside transporter PnuC [Sphingomonas sp. MMSM20]|uniref:nicotinamide riboside transporter PnuC n=1 Tax=Sphingomonas lycopersici TaxID=2951807 RepID=UPI0022380F4D|nr:nicotinamide riboside transporter PnuC [Sphingomonas lycopersici]MCW6532695.1 nicotinamide riboside transporter PnuC [Sphingomonas lycopersici]